jgi:hypothetical protein
MASNALSTGDSHSGVGVALVVSFMNEPEVFCYIPTSRPIIDYAYREEFQVFS